MIVVGHEITNHTRDGLMDNLLLMVFTHPIRRLAAEAISQMQRGVIDANAPAKRILNFDIYGPENL